MRRCIFPFAIWKGFCFSFRCLHQATRFDEKTYPRENVDARAMLAGASMNQGSRWYDLEDGMEQLDYPSEHFSLYLLGPGVYAAIDDPDGAAYCNAGIIDLGDRTVVVDSFETIAAAEDLKAAAQTLTGRPASAVILTHEHGDHWYGNQVFSPPVMMISAASARQAMQVWLDEEVDEIRSKPSEFIPLIEEYQENAASAESEELRLVWERRALRMQRGMQQAPALYPRLPDLTFEKEVQLLGRERSVEVINYGHAHSNGDVCVFVPDVHAAFIGDLGFFGRHPYLLNSIPQRWVEVLQTLEWMPFDSFVPGHGPIGGKEAIQELRSYMQTLMEFCSEAKDAGRSLEEILEMPYPQSLYRGPESDDYLKESVKFLVETVSI